MFGTTARSVLRRSVVSTPLTRQSRTLFISAAKPRWSLKSTALRWVALGGVIYYYGTSSAFAEEPKFIEERPPQSTIDEERPPSLIDDVRKAAKERQGQATEGDEDSEHVSPTVKSEANGAPVAQPGSKEVGSIEAGAGELAEEAGQEGAFNPETGEINWDCPCLGGMAHGPCGEDFKAAFSCFVYSTADPKGVDCVDKFKAMQTCFQAHPEIYGAELDDDEDELDIEKPVDAQVEEPQESRVERPEITEVDPTPSDAPLKDKKPEDKPEDKKPEDTQ